MIAAFLLIVPLILLLYSTKELVMGGTITISMEMVAVVLFSSVLILVFVAINIRIWQDIRYDHMIVARSIGKGIATPVSNVKGIIKRSLAYNDLAFETVLKGKRRLSLGDIESKGSEVYSVDGNRLYLVAVNLNDPDPPTVNHSAILIGPFTPDNLPIIQRLCHDIDHELKESDIYNYTLDTSLEFYYQRPWWPKLGYP